MATNVDIDSEDSTTIDEAVEVYVGGTLITFGYVITSDSPVTVEFDSPPVAGSAVAILVRRGVNWYNPGPTTPSDGIALQETDNKVARFLRGQ